MSQLQIIETNEIEDRYARGWHCLGLADDYKDGKAHTLEIFGTKLVAYQGEDGEVHVLNAYCPHMGGDLSKGCIEGNSIRCPFHDWRWDENGVCDDIPYAKRIPRRAKIKSWPTSEQNKLLFIWNDPENNPPIDEQAIPRIDEVFSDDWADWEIALMHIKTNVRELVDNVADKSHFGPVHGAPDKYFANRFEKHVAEQTLISNSERLSEGNDLKTVATYYGPSYQITHMTGEMGGVPIHSILLNCHVPVDLNNFQLRYGVLVQKVPGMTDEQNREIAQAYITKAQDAFYEDVEIWDNKLRVDNPLLCDGDGPVYQLRKWYKQFYTDIAEVNEEQTKKQTFEYSTEAKEAEPA